MAQNTPKEGDFVQLGERDIFWRTMAQLGELKAIKWHE
jgi:hypothetical protein